MPLQMPSRARLRACARARAYMRARLREARGGALGGLQRRPGHGFTQAKGTQRGAGG